MATPASDERTSWLQSGPVAWFDNQMDADAIVVGAGLAGLTATAELARAGRRVLLLDQEPESNLGGQAFWSFGGLFLVGSPEQRRMGIRDSRELAWQDWMGSAFFDRGADDPAGEDYWAYRWAQAYVDFAAGEKRSWLHGMGVRWLPLVGWAERGGYLADGHGNSVPRFHVTWGTGPAVVAPFERQVRESAGSGLVGLRFRHRVDGLIVTRGTVDGVRGAILEPSQAARGTRSSRVEVGEFELHAPAVIVTSGGIGGNIDLVRASWPDRLGPAPDRMICGVPEHVDGRMLGIAERAGGRLVNRDRMWHYTEGIQNWDPIWAGHGIRILPGPSSLWFDARPQVPGAAFPRVRHPGHAGGHPGHRIRLLVVRAHPEDHREGVRAVRLGAEPRPDRQGHQAHPVPGAAGRRRPGGSVQGARGRLRGGQDAAGAGGGNEQADPRAASGTGRPGTADRRARPGDR